MADSPIQTLMYRLKGKYPSLELSLDAPVSPDGEWFLDASLGSRQFTIQWHRLRGFGLSFTLGEYGENPSEVYTSIDAVFGRIVSVLSESSVQQAREEMCSLSELRKRFGISQASLAELIGAKQSTLSNLERAQDAHLSSVRKVIEALGGEMRIVADFGDSSVAIKFGE